MKEIKIIIGKDGKVNLKVEGIKGAACHDLTKKLVEALGTVEKTENTGGFYEQEVKIEDQQSLGEQ